ncbi:MAG TPA: hydrogenase 2 operon protein HybA [Anaeromyxobacteraceae bacterium]|nr:hydrogenase 2 operon protein HybA [Anaeromyxobacteraceae bacterium]
MTGMRRRTALKVLAGGVGASALRPAQALEQPAYPDAVGLLYDSTRCIGCRACVTWCKRANELPDDEMNINGVPYNAPVDLSSTTKNIIRVAKDGDHTAFVKGGCMHCTEPACVNACMIGALKKNPTTGVVAYNVDLCVGCRYCQVVCPFNVPKFTWHSAFNSRIVKCELCRHLPEGPACARVCPRQAIVTGKVTELKAEARRRLSAQPAAYHPQVYGEREAGGTQVLYLAPAAMPPDKLGLPNVGDAPIPTLSHEIHGGIYKAGIAPVALYAAFAFVTWKNRRSQAAGSGKEEGHK